MAKGKMAQGKRKARANIGQTGAGRASAESADPDVTPPSIASELGLELDELEPTAENAIRALVEEFLGRLDEPLIRAIAYDHDDIGRNVAAIRNALLPLAEGATAEEESSYQTLITRHAENSSLSGFKDDFTAAGHDADDEYDTDEVAATASLRGLTLSEVWPNEATATSPSETSADDLKHEKFAAPCQGDLSEDEKIESLWEIFAGFAPLTIRSALRHSNGDLEKAFDDLVSRKFLLDNGELAKGIDAFAVSDDEVVRNRGQPKPPRNQAKKKVVPLAYSVKPTVSGEELLGTGVLSKVQYSTNKYDHRQFQKPAVPSTSATPEFSGPPLRLTTGPAPAGSRAAGPQWQTVVSKKTVNRCNRDRGPYSDNEDMTSHNRRVAAEMHRRGGVYGAAAAIYSTRAVSDARALISREAESLVSQTSTADQIDLHGVSVMDGVRIAKSRVAAWWDTLDGEDRARRAKDPGFTVITGVGHHSLGGVSRLREAVGTALRNAGWKVQTLSGMYCVVGRV